jgi:hypothetical protein
MRIEAARDSFARSRRCSTQPYIRGLASSLQEAGWDVLAWNFRGCSGVPNRLPRAYHSGETRDFGAVIAHARRICGACARSASVWWKITLKYLGEAPPHAAIVAAAAISTPVDLAAGARWLDREPRNRLYLRRFIKSLVAKIEEKAAPVSRNTWMPPTRAHPHLSRSSTIASPRRCTAFAMRGLLDPARAARQFPCQTSRVADAVVELRATLHSHARNVSRSTRAAKIPRSFSRRPRSGRAHGLSRFRTRQADA